MEKREKKRDGKRREGERERNIDKRRERKIEIFRVKAQIIEKSLFLNHLKKTFRDC